MQGYKRMVFGKRVRLVRVRMRRMDQEKRRFKQFKGIGERRMVSESRSLNYEFCGLKRNVSARGSEMIHMSDTDAGDYGAVEEGHER